MVPIAKVSLLFVSHLLQSVQCLESINPSASIVSLATYGFIDHCIGLSNKAGNV